MDKPTRNRTPLTPEESFKLYLPLGVEAAAKRIFKGQQGIFNGSPEPENEALYSLEHAFRSLLCKLAQVVDNRKGGDTVTSFVALQEYGKTNFLFCSNQRREDDLKDTASFVKSLLVFIRDKPNGIGPKPLLKRVLWRIVLFNVPRIGFYLDALTKALEDCIADCGRKRELEEKAMLEQLKERTNFPRDLVSSTSSQDQFLSGCETLIKAIMTSQTSRLDGVIRNKAKDGNISNSEPWSRLSHYMGRLYSYRAAAVVLISAAEHWPDLLLDFEVSYIPSSRPAKNPMPDTPHIEGTKDAIMSMASEAEMVLYEEHLGSWEALGLDDAIKHQLYRETFRPIVHAEVLLHNELLKREKTHPRDFFSGWKFIGTSKPTCRLCSYYFSEYADMAVRPSHRSLYAGWRYPDVFQDEGSTALNKRSKVLEKIAARASQDALNLLREKVFQGRQHDTNTHSDLPGIMEDRFDSSADSSSIFSFSDEEPVFDDCDSQSSAGSSGIPSDGKRVDDGELDADSEEDSDGGVLV